MQWNKAPWLDLGDREPWTSAGHAPIRERVSEPPRGKWGEGAWGWEKQSFLAPQHKGVQSSRAGGGAWTLPFAQVPQDWGSLAPLFEKCRCGDLVPRFRAEKRVALRKGSRP